MTNPPAILPTSIPSTPSGYAFTFQSGETPERLEFRSDVSGTEFGDDIGDTEPNVFTYTYAVTGTGTANLVLRFKADKWDEYALVFTPNSNSGTFVRREFDKNALKDSDSGTFSGASTTP